MDPGQSKRAGGKQETDQDIRSMAPDQYFRQGIHGSG